MKNYKSLKLLLGMIGHASTVYMNLSYLLEGLTD